MATFSNSEDSVCLHLNEWVILYRLLVKVLKVCYLQKSNFVFYDFSTSQRTFLKLLAEHSKIYANFGERKEHFSAGPCNFSMVQNPYRTYFILVYHNSVKLQLHTML